MNASRCSSPEGYDKTEIVVIKIEVRQQDNGQYVPLVFGQIIGGRGGFYVCDATKFPDAVI
ncbi:hypothetical protein, partial [Flavobacterium sp.]|uniref:hypothetical protein n=1 Tax=Flavobacterium sp. TaxID=239 RepID=UPI003265112F